MENTDNLYPKTTGPWSEMTDNERNAWIAINLFNWQWECWDSLFPGDFQRCIIPPKDSNYQPTNYPRLYAKPCGEDVKVFSDWHRNAWPINGKGPRGVPDWINELNLIHEAEAAVLKLVSWPDYVAALSEVAGGITTAIRATAAQRAEACWRVMQPKETSAKAESVPSRVWRRDRERFSELYPFGIDGHCPEIE